MDRLVGAYVKEAALSLASARQRSLLALIGIVIGVSSVIAMVSVGTIVKREAARQFQELGTDVLNIRLRARGAAASSRSEWPVTLEDALGIATLPTIVQSAPFLSTRGQATLAAKEVVRVVIVGVTEAFADLNKLEVASGRFISDLDHRRYFCVVGAGIAAAMRGAGAQRIVGETIRIDDTIWTVVGVLQRTRQGLRSVAIDHSAIVPISTAQRVFARPGVRDITARMSPAVHHLAATAQVRRYFRRTADGVTVRVESAEKLIEQMHKQMRLFTLLLGTVGAISLLVGGIGVMNVMLVSVTERRLEIGIRRALGARRRDIQRQFLTESVILSLLGGAFGIALGIGASYLISHYNGWTFLVSAPAVGLGVGITGGAGIFFGFYPAWQAARLDPVTTLRGR